MTTRGWKCQEPRLKMSHSLVWPFQPRVVTFPCPTNDCVSHVLSYDQLQKSWIISKRNAIESETRDCLSSKNAHSPNYCSWLVVCVNYSANFYCKIPLINRLELYLIKTYSKTSKKPKNKLNVNKNNVEYITWRHTVWHYNVTCVTVKRWTYDNAQRHVTAFWPIREAAHSWSYDNQIWWIWGWKCRMRAQPECDMFNRELSYLNVARMTVLHLFCRMTNH